MDTKKTLYILGVVIFLALLSRLEIDNIQREYEPQVIHERLGTNYDGR